MNEIHVSCQNLINHAGMSAVLAELIEIYLDKSSVCRAGCMPIISPILPQNLTTCNQMNQAVGSAGDRRLSQRCFSERDESNRAHDILSDPHKFP
jgi:hypothetical protein